MKRILTAFLFLFVASFTMMACQVDIVIDSVANEYVAQVTGVTDYTLVWQDGTTGPTYPINPADSLICVNLIAPDSTCFNTSCLDFLPQFCSVEVVVDSLPGMLTAIPGGTAPFSYLWSNGSTGPSVWGSMGEQYCVVVTDAEGCVADTCYTLDSLFCSVWITEIDTIGSGNQLTASAFGAAPYTYSWSTGEIGETITVNSPGEYCVTLTDSEGCVSTNCYYYYGSSCSVDVVMGDIAPTGIPLEAIASGGVAPYQYLWSSGETTSWIAVDGPGDYCVTITDAAGCVSTDCLFFGNQCSVDVILGDIAPTGIPLEAITSGGVAPYTYSWSTGETTSWIAVNAPGDYCVTITDAAGCVSTDCLFFGNQCSVDVVLGDFAPAGIPLEAIASGGVAPYTYSWSTGETTSWIQVTAPGDYCVTITDAAGCVSTDCLYTCPSCSVEILEIDSTGTNSLLALATGVAPFQYLWSTGETSNSIEVNSSGSYCVDIIDAFGCEATACYYFGNTNCSVSIVEIPDTITGENVLFANGSGVGSLLYFWNDGTIGPYVYQPDPNFLYCVTMVDTVGMCTTTYCQDSTDCDLSISQIDSISSTVLTANHLLNIAATYSWNTGETTQSILVTEPGTYCVEAIFANGCVAYECLTVQDSTFGCWVTITESTDSSGQSYLHAFTPWPPALQILWNTGETTAAIAVDEVGEYCVTVSLNGESCTTCYYYDLPVYTNDITGLIHLPDSNINVQILVELFQLNGGDPATLVDTTYVEASPIFDNQYYFYDVADGTYVVRASQVDDGTAPIYVPTYHFNSLTSDAAEIITTPHLDTEWYSVLMTPVIPMTGPGQVDGIVTDGFNKSFAPEAGVTVILTDLLGNAINFKYSADDGTFKMDQIAIGDYYLVVDVPGMKSVKKLISITEDDNIRTGIVIEVTEEGITVGVHQIIENELQAVPNPASNYLQITGLENIPGVIHYQIYSLSGQLVDASKNFEPTAKIWVGDLLNGIYFLKVQSESKEQVIKISIVN